MSQAQLDAWAARGIYPEPEHDETPACAVCKRPFRWVVGGYYSGPSHYEQADCSCDEAARVALVDALTGAIECVCSAAEFVEANVDSDLDFEELADAIESGEAFMVGGGAAPLMRVEPLNHLATKRRAMTTLLTASRLMLAARQERAGARADALAAVRIALDVREAV